MGLSSKFLILACLACLYPNIQSLSIPPPTTHIGTTVLRGDSSEEATTTANPNDDINDGLGDLDSSDPSGTDNVNQNGSVPGRLKPVLEVVDVIFRPFRPPSILVMDFFRKPNSSSSSEESGGPTTDSSESNTGTTVSSSDGNNSGSNEVNSKERNGGIMSSINVDSTGHDNNSGASSEASGTTGIFSHKPVIGMTVANNPVAAQKQFTKDNEDNDDARRMSDKQNSPDDGNDDGDFSSMPASINVASSMRTDGVSGGNSSGGGGDNNSQRRKRETHQMGNISQGDDDSSSTFSKNITGKFQQDDMTKSNNNDDNGNNGGGSATLNDAIDGDDDDTDDNGQRKTTDGNKSGTVKIFLEILQLVPLSNSTTQTSSNGDDDDNESNSVTTTTSASITTASADEKEDTDIKTFVQSMKANSNQKKFSANSLTANSTSNNTGMVQERKRVARSATTQPPSMEKKEAGDAEKKGNPSKSPTASASPSSATTSKPVTSKDAPAATTTKASVSSTTPDDSEGPPLENVTESSKDD